MSESEDSDDDESILMVSETTAAKDVMLEYAMPKDLCRVENNVCRSLNNLVISSAWLYCGQNQLHVGMIELQNG